MKNILCYGDSNTWGQNPKTRTRFSRESRWPGVLQSLLGPEFHIIEEGLKSRTICHEDPYREGRNGYAAIPTILETHSPLDAVIVMLGTNDLKARYALTAYSVAEGVSRLAERILKLEPGLSQLVLVCPPRVVKTDDFEHSMTFEGAIEKSERLPEFYSYFAKELACHFLNAEQYAQSSVIDGVHIEEDGHRQLGQAIGNVISKIL